MVSFSKKDISELLSQGYRLLEEAMHVPSADDTKVGANPVEEVEVEIPRMRGQLPQVGHGEWNMLVEAWEDGYSVGSQSFSPLRMWTKDARKRAWAVLPQFRSSTGSENASALALKDEQNERDYFSTRLGSLAAMYRAVTHIEPEEMPTRTRDVEARGAVLLKREAGAAADVAAVLSGHQSTNINNRVPLPRQS